MGSHLTPSPCLAGIRIVPILFPLWLFLVQFIGFRALSPSLAYLHKALLGGHRAQPPCQAATGYKPSQNLSNCTKILQNLLNGKKMLEMRPHRTKNIAGFTKGREYIGGVARSTPNQERGSTARPKICRREICLRTLFFSSEL